MSSNKFLISVLISLIFYTICQAQSKGDNAIKVKEMSFAHVCEGLLDAGYNIEKKDADLQTVETGYKTGIGKNKWMKLKLLIRVKDSTAIISGFWYNTMMLGHKILGQEQTIETLAMPIENTNGNPKACFKEMSAFANTLGKNIEYSKR